MYKKIISAILVTAIFSIIAFAETMQIPKPIVYLQTLATNDQDGADQLQLRKARLIFKGAVDESISYFFYFGTEQALVNSMLLDAYIDYKTPLGLTIRSGQVRTPFSKEYLVASSKYDTVDFYNSIGSLIGTTNSGYDQGVQAMGSQGNIDYSVGIFNGSGRNNADTDDNKNIIGRVDVKDVMPGVTVGASYLTGKDSATDTTTSGVAGSAKYKQGPLELKTEIMSIDHRDVKANGGFVQAAYYVMPDTQALIAYDLYDVNTDNDDDNVTTLTVGVNYFMSKNTKLSCNYVIPTNETNDPDDNLFYTQLQVVF